MTKENPLREAFGKLKGIKGKTGKSTDELLKEVDEELGSRFDPGKDLGIEMACKSYENGEISLRKAVELAGVGYEKMKKVLKERGVGAK
nr:UPF0175 family protein [Candidatus Woesearchaeota archaeon]